MEVPLLFAYSFVLAPGGFGSGTWFRNTAMFADRFGTKWSWEGPQRSVFIVIQAFQRCFCLLI